MFILRFWGKQLLGAGRSEQWPAVRSEHLKEYPECAVCGGKKKTEVHHIKVFKDYPELELEPTNLITLCESKKYGVNCHLFIGHLGNYKKSNPDVVKDAREWYNKINN